jgi:hypothetical protein
MANIFENCTAIGNGGVGFQINETVVHLPPDWINDLIRDAGKFRAQPEARELIEYAGTRDIDKPHHRAWLAGLLDRVLCLGKITADAATALAPYVGLINQMLSV